MTQPVDRPLIAAADRLAGWFDSPAYLTFWSAAIGRLLTLRPGARLADVGAGACVVARRLADDHRLGRVDCVDPFCEPAPAARGAPLFHHALAAEDFARTMAPTDAVLAQRMLHHVPAVDRAALMADLARALVPGGRLLVVTMPPTLDYPLFEAARQHFAAHQIHHTEIAGHLAAAGLVVTSERVAFPVAISRTEFAAMVRARFLSTLAAFDDATIEAGLAELAATPGSTTELRFDDAYYCVLGERT